MNLNVLSVYMDVSENRGTPKSSILIGFSIINHHFGVPLFLETPIYLQTFQSYIRSILKLLYLMKECMSDSGHLYTSPTVECSAMGHSKWEQSRNVLLGGV